LGFALLSKVSMTLLERLQATRMRLLDLYGDHRVK
jgi:N-acetyl-gamma-glutamylphosphate reductase